MINASLFRGGLDRRFDEDAEYNTVRCRRAEGDRACANAATARPPSPDHCDDARSWGVGMAVIADVAKGRDNNFNLLRMLAATAVLLSHSWPLALGTGIAEPLKLLTGYKLGTIAVMLFFATSGFFITKSFATRTSVSDFVVARVARIFPGLFVVLALSAFLLGPVLTALPLSAYFGDPHAWTYVPRNLLLFPNHQWTLPGLFEANPIPAVNGSLWTLFYEAACYALVAGAILLGLARPATFPILLGLLVAIALGIEQRETGHFLAKTSILLLPFAIGAAAYIYRRFVPVSALLAIALAVLAAATRSTVFYFVTFPLAVAYAGLWFGFARLPYLRAYNRLGDLSYGVYIYAFPIQQVMVALFRITDPVLLAGAALPPVLVMAFLSWHLVESPALAHRHVLRTLGPWGRRIVLPGGSPALS
jgi:peptidoglycan/LPS O-acetylase OafA/YrhL